MSYPYICNVAARVVMLGVCMAPLAHAANNQGKSPSPSHYRKGASCVQETSKAAMFTCWGMFENKLIGVEEIYKHGWRVVAFKPRTYNPDIIDNGILIIEEQ